MLARSGFESQTMEVRLPALQLQKSEKSSNVV